MVTSQSKTACFKWKLITVVACTINMPKSLKDCCAQSTGANIECCGSSDYLRNRISPYDEDTWTAPPYYEDENESMDSWITFI